MSAYSVDYVWQTSGRLSEFEGFAFGYSGGPPHAVSHVDGALRYTYNVNGNMTGRNLDQNNPETLEWDVENRLHSFTKSTLAEEYLYDAGGVRIWKKSGGTETFYVNRYFEVDANGDTTKYYYFGNRRVAMRKDGVLTMLHIDHLGSVVASTDSSGHTNRQYRAYGRYRSGGTPPTDHQFTGQKQDETGFLYYGARYYDRVLGTFISPDPLIPDPTNLFAYNRYMYVLGNPLKYNDPSGHCAVTSTGERDSADAACWTLADTVESSWQADTEWWSSRWNMTSEEWMDRIAVQGFADEAYLDDQLHRFWSPWYASRGFTSSPYNSPPVWHEPPEQPLIMPGKEVMGAAINDVFECSGNFPTGCAKAADDAALVVTGGAVILCGAATAGACLPVGLTVATGLSGFGAGITTWNAMQGNASAMDAAVALGTTLVGGKFGVRGKGGVGFVTSLFQRMYDSWSNY